MTPEKTNVVHKVNRTERIYFSSKELKKILRSRVSVFKVTVRWINIDLIKNYHIALWVDAE